MATFRVMPDAYITLHHGAHHARRLCLLKVGSGISAWHVQHTHKHTQRERETPGGQCSVIDGAVFLSSFSTVASVSRYVLCPPGEYSPNYADRCLVGLYTRNYRQTAVPWNAKGECRASLYTGLENNLSFCASTLLVG